MKLKLIKSAVFESDAARHHDQRIIDVVVKELGKQSAYRIFEAYEVNPRDYTKWLDVIVGYAGDEGIKLNNKSSFFDVAFAVLDNDPANIDHDLQEAIVNKLWIDFKSNKQQSKIDRLHKVAREEEQLSYAIKSMKPRRSTEDEQFLSGAGMEEEEYETDWDIDDEYEGYDDDDSEDYDLEDDIPFTDDEQDDYQIEKRGREMSKSRDLDDFDPSENESQDRDSHTSRRGREMNKSRDLDDFDPSEKESHGRDRHTSRHGREMSKSRDLDNFDPSEKEFRRPKRSKRSEENEEQVKFPKNELVHYKKDGNNYCVAIEDGPGDTIGLMMNSRIKLVPTKDVEPIKSEENEEGFTRSSGRNKTSLLHDVLTGEKSREHLNKLQKQIEDEGANVFTNHHTKSPRNPHPTGSFAYKSWQKGFDSTAKELWGPRPVKVDDKKSKTKPKPKK